MRALSPFKLCTIVLGVVCISGVFTQSFAQDQDRPRTHADVCSERVNEWGTATSQYNDSCGVVASDDGDDTEEQSGNSTCTSARQACATYLDSNLPEFGDSDFMEDLPGVYSEYGRLCPTQASTRYASTKDRYTSQLDRLEGLEKEKRDLAKSMVESMTSQQQLSQQAQAQRATAQAEMEKAEREFASTLERQKAEFSERVKETGRTVLGHINTIKRIRNVEIPNARAQYQQAVQGVQRGCEESARVEAKRLLEQWRRRAEQGRMRKGSVTSNLVTKKGFAQKGAKKEFAECKKRSRLEIENAERQYQAKIRDLEARIDQLASEIALMRSEILEDKNTLDKQQATMSDLLQSQLNAVRTDILNKEREMSLQMQSQFQMAALDQQHMNELEERLRQESFMYTALATEERTLARFATGTSNKSTVEQFLDWDGLEIKRTGAGTACCSSEYFNQVACTRLGYTRDENGDISDGSTN